MIKPVVLNFQQMTDSFFSVGLGYKKKNLGLDFAYTYLIMEDSEPGEISYLEGEYEGNAHIFAIDIRYQF